MGGVVRSHHLRRSCKPQNLTCAGRTSLGLGVLQAGCSIVPDPETEEIEPTKVQSCKHSDRVKITGRVPPITRRGAEALPVLLLTDFSFVCPMPISDPSPVKSPALNASAQVLFHRVLTSTKALSNFRRPLIRAAATTYLSASPHRLLIFFTPTFSEEHIAVFGTR